MQQPVKPRALGDIVSRRARPRLRGDKLRPWDAFSVSRSRLNLSFRKRNVRIPLAKLMRPAIIAAAVAFFVFGSALAPTIFMHASGDTATSTNAAATEQSQLESQLQQLETQINQYQGQITSYEKQGNTLSSQIATLNAKIASINLQIRATNLTLSELNDNITQTQSQIAVTQADIVDKKAALGDLIQELYENDQVSLIEAFLKDPQLSDFWNDTQNITLLQDNLRVGVVQVTDLQGQLQDQEQQFEASKQDTMSIAAVSGGAGERSCEHQEPGESAAFGNEGAGVEV